MTKPKKITIAEVRNAYSNTGINPIIEETVKAESLCACPLGVLYFNGHPTAFKVFQNGESYFRTNFFCDIVINWAEKKYGVRYVDGFLHGVDGTYDILDSDCYDYNIYEDADFQRGLKEGNDVVEKSNIFKKDGV